MVGSRADAADDAQLHARAHARRPQLHARAHARRRSLTPGRTPAARSLTPGRTPAARSLTPGRTPAARNLTPPRTPVARAPARPAEPRARPDAPRRFEATPPPTTPLPPARARGYTPLESSRDSELTPRATPPQPQNVVGHNPTMLGRPAPNPAAVPAGAAAVADPCSAPKSSPQSSSPIQLAIQPQSTMRGPAPAGRRPSNPSRWWRDTTLNRTGRQRPEPAARRGAAGHARLRRQRRPPRDFALAQTSPGAARFAGAMGGHPIPVAPDHETARVQFRPQRQWGGVFMVIAAVAGRGRRRRAPVGDPARRPHRLEPAHRARDQRPSRPGASCAWTGRRWRRPRRPRSRSGAIATITPSRRAGRLPAARETIRYDKSAIAVDGVRLLERDPNDIPPPPPSGAPAAPSAGPPRSSRARSPRRGTDAVRRAGARASGVAAGRDATHSGRGGGGRGGGGDGGRRRRRRRMTGRTMVRSRSSGPTPRGEREVPDHLPADTLDPHQLVDRAERMAFR